MKTLVMSMFTILCFSPFFASAGVATAETAPSPTTEALLDELKTLNQALRAQTSEKCAYGATYDFNGKADGCLSQVTARMVVSESSVAFAQSMIDKLRSFYRLSCGENDYVADKRGLLLGCQNGVGEVSAEHLSPTLLKGAEAFITRLTQSCRGQLWYDNTGNVSFCPE